MTNEDLKNELLELIKHYQAILYNYNQYPNYNNMECSYRDAEERLKYYTEEYSKLIN